MFTVTNENLRSTSKVICILSLEEFEEVLKEILMDLVRFTAWKVSAVFGVFLVRVFPHSGWIRNVSLRIQSECGKVRTRKTSNTDTFHLVIALHHSLWNQILSEIFSFWLRTLLEAQLGLPRTSKIESFTTIVKC